MRRLFVLCLLTVSGCDRAETSESDTDIATKPMTGAKICTRDYFGEVPHRNVFVAPTIADVPDLVITGDDGCVLVPLEAGTWQVQAEQTDTTCEMYWHQIHVADGQTSELVVLVDEGCFD